MKCISFIQPEGLALPVQPNGPLAMKWSLKCTLGKMKYGGTLLPNAETAKANVTSVPLSADVILPIC